MAIEKPSILRLGPGAKLSNSTVSGNTITGNADLINSQGSIEDSVIEDNKLFPDGQKWPDIALDQSIAEPTPSRPQRTLKWAKDKLLGPLLVAAIVAIATYLLKISGLF